MTYIYPKIQSVISDTVFLMKNTLETNKYSSYQIQYRQYDSVLTGCITHAEIDALLRSGYMVVYSKPTFAEGEPFIKIPIKYLKPC